MEPANADDIAEAAAVKAAEIDYSSSVVESIVVPESPIIELQNQYCYQGLTLQSCWYSLRNFPFK